MRYAIREAIVIIILDISSNFEYESRDTNLAFIGSSTTKTEARLLYTSFLRNGIFA